MIYISAGHSGLGTGVHGLIDEGMEAIKMRNQIVAELTSLGVPETDIAMDNDQAPLKKVIADVNQRCKHKSKDIAIEIHFNAAALKTDTEANGTETVVADTHSDKSEKIAIDLNRVITETLGTTDRTKGRGFKTEKDTSHKKLGFLRDVKCPSVIAEICFVRNQEDVTKYKANRERLCLRIAETLKKWHR